MRPGIAAGACKRCWASPRRSSAPPRVRGKGAAAVRAVSTGGTSAGMHELQAGLSGSAVRGGEIRACGIAGGAARLWSGGGSAAHLSGELHVQAGLQPKMLATPLQGRSFLSAALAAASCSAPKCNGDGVACALRDWPPQPKLDCAALRGARSPRRQPREQHPVARHGQASPLQAGELSGRRARGRSAGQEAAPEHPEGRSRECAAGVCRCGSVRNRTLPAPAACPNHGAALHVPIPTAWLDCRGAG